MDLIYDTLEEACSSSAIFAGRLVCTVRNVLELYHHVLPVAHAATLATIPQHAGRWGGEVWHTMWLIVLLFWVNLVSHSRLQVLFNYFTVFNKLYLPLWIYVMSCNPHQLKLFSFCSEFCTAIYEYTLTNCYLIVPQLWYTTTACSSPVTATSWGISSKQGQ